MQHLAVIAQALEGNNVLYGYGPLGVICLWFMWRGERIAGEIKNLSHRIDGLTRALLVDVISRDGVGHHAKEAAQKELARIEGREKA